jgi:calcium-dependent protein kinase
MDLDGNGYIDYTEFVAATMDLAKLTEDKKLASAFKLFDKDGSGTISPDEIAEVLGLTENAQMNENLKMIIE